jgi:hypothetical protein
MAVVKGTRKMLQETQHGVLSPSIVDQCKCIKLLSTFEKYSTKLDKLLETTSNIEQESRRKYR